MEEILASIRRIIAEDGDAAPAPGTPAAPGAPPAGSQRQDEVLELTEVVDEDGSVVSLGAKPATPEPPPAQAAVEPVPAPEPESEPEPESGLEQPAPEPELRDEDDADRLVSAATAVASVAALSQLVGKGSSRDRAPEDIPLGAAGRTLEDLVRELLRPLLKSWLDDHLPPLVERLVREEIGRLVREVQGR